MDGSEHAVVAGADGSLAVDGQQYEPRLVRKGASQYVVTVGDKAYEVRLVEGAVDKGELLIEVAGERVEVRVTDVLAGGAAGSASGRAGAGQAAAAKAAKGAKPAPKLEGHGVFAPMPGKVLEVFVEAGDEVDAEDVVLILEAMKMENELHSPRKGRVKAVHVKKGDPVAGQQLLVELE